MEMAKNNEFDMVVNTNMIVAGVDIPVADTILYYKLNSSLSTLIQSIGRVMRGFPVPGAGNLKENCLVIDMGNTVAGLFSKMKARRDGYGEAASGKLIHKLNQKIFDSVIQVFSYCKSLDKQVDAHAEKNQQFEQEIKDAKKKKEKAPLIPKMPEWTETHNGIHVANVVTKNVATEQPEHMVGMITKTKGVYVFDENGKKKRLNGYMATVTRMKDDRESIALCNEDNRDIKTKFFTSLKAAKEYCMDESVAVLGNLYKQPKKTSDQREANLLKNMEKISDEWTANDGKIDTDIQGMNSDRLHATLVFRGTKNSPFIEDVTDNRDTTDRISLNPSIYNAMEKRNAAWGQRMIGLHFDEMRKSVIKSMSEANDSSQVERIFVPPNEPVTEKMALNICALMSMDSNIHIECGHEKQARELEKMMVRNTTQSSAKLISRPDGSSGRISWISPNEPGAYKKLQKDLEANKAGIFSDFHDPEKIKTAIKSRAENGMAQTMNMR